eukprot:4490397-Pyramimonas_sp.AAC.1
MVELVTAPYQEVEGDIPCYRQHPIGTWSAEPTDGVHQGLSRVTSDAGHWLYERLCSANLARCLSIWAVLDLDR